MRAISSGDIFSSPSWRAFMPFHAERSAGSCSTSVRERERNSSPFFCASHSGTSLTGFPLSSMSVSDGRSFSCSGTSENALSRRYMRRRDEREPSGGSDESLFSLSLSHFRPLNSAIPSRFVSALRSRFM